MADRVVVMGVSGAGKSTVGAVLAARLGAELVEGDALHPHENVEKMRRGRPLTDADRAPWLDAVAAVLETRQRVVVTCSALRRAYRDRLRAAAPDVLFVHVDVPRPELVERLRRRTGHFMPASLLDSQLATLEPLEPDELGVVVDGTAAPEQVAAAALAQLPGETKRRAKGIAAGPTRRTT